MTTNETINQNVDFTVEQVRNILYGCMDNCQRIFKKYDLEDYANWGIAQKKEYFGGKVVIFTSTSKSRKTKRDGCEKRNAFIETKTKCASNLIRKVTAYLQNQSKTPSLYIKINGIQMDF